MNINKSEHDWVILVTGTWNRIITMDELKKHAKYDPEKHGIIEEVHKVRDGQQKSKDGEPTIIQLHSNSLKLKHIYSEVQRDIIEAIQWYKQPERDHEKKIDPVTGKLGALYLADAHVGKLDIKWTSLLKQVKLMSRSIKQALDKLSDYWVDEYLIAWLWDNVNTDFKSKTTKGTEQENNANDKDMYKAFIDLDVDVVDYASQLWVLSERHIPGNHDEERTFYIDHFMKHHFANNGNVKIEWDAESHQYHKFGNTGMLLHHGDKIRDNNIVGMWYNNLKSIKFLESHSGHHHTDQILDLKWAKAYKHPSMWWKNTWARSVNVWWDYGKFNSIVYDKKEWKEAMFVNQVK